MSADCPGTAAITALAFLILAGCGSASEDAGVDEVAAPRQVEFSNVWSADPGIDLFSRGAELIRATREAGELTVKLGADNSFPGYQEALPHDTDVEEFDFNSVVVGRRAPEGQGPFTIYRHLSDLTSSDSKVSATVCAYAIHSEEGVWPDGEDLSFASRIELVNAGSAPGSPGIEDSDEVAHDPGATMPPNWNVFGSWKISEFRTAKATEIPSGCTKWWQERFPSYTVREPGDKTLIPPDGYTRPVMPVAPQYPEWIAAPDLS